MNSKERAFDLHLFFGIFFFATSLLLNPKNFNTEIEKILPPPEGVEFVHFGFEQTISDLLWLSFIQSNWECSKYQDPEGEKCPYRWGFRVLKSASLLDPKFITPHLQGATKLTFILDDHKGAEELFLTGLEYYPSDWILNYRLAYLYIEEIKDAGKAAKYLEIASNNGAPWWTKSLSSKLYSRSGQKQLSYTVLKQLYDETEKPEIKKSLEERLAALAFEIRNLSSEREDPQN